MFRKNLSIYLVILVLVVILATIYSVKSYSVKSAPPDFVQLPEVSGVVRFPRITPPGRDDLAPEGPDSNISSNKTPQNETSVAVHPNNPNFVVAAAHDYRNGDATCAFYKSLDAGATWSFKLLDRLGYSTSGDPAIAMDKNGVIYQSCLHFNRGGNVENAIVVHTSSDGGLTFSSQIIASSNNGSYLFGGGTFHDKEYIAVDEDTGAVYVSWTRFGSGRSDILLSYKSAGSGTFSEPMVVSDGPVNQGSIPVLRKDPLTGQKAIYIAWISFSPTTEIRIDSAPVDFSTGAVTGFFGFDKVVSPIARIPSKFTGQDFRTNSDPSLAADKLTGNLYLVWAEDPPGADEADVVLSRSTDAGENWSAHLRINDDTTTRDQFFPRIATNPNGGIHVVWYDKRNDARDLAFHAYYAKSNSGGLSFLPNIRISDNPSKPSKGDAFGGRFIGDYIGIAASSISAHPVFMGYNRNDQEIYAERVLSE